MRIIVITILSAIGFATVGICLLIWASAITEFYRKHYASNRILRRVSVMRAWVDGPYYETMLRVIGIVMLGLAAFLLFVIARGLLDRGQ